MLQSDIHELFSKSLIGDYDDEAPWDAVAALQRIGSREVFEIAAVWCRSDTPLKRARGLDVLAQLGKTAEHPQQSFPAESYSIVVSVLKQEQEVRPLMSAIYALGHIDNIDAVPLIVAYQFHSNPGVRYAVTFALSCFPNDDQSVETLLLFLDDADDDVRDWATFALGSLSGIDSAQVRDALFQKLSDTNEDVREEAIAGLAKRRDERVLPMLIDILEKPPVSHCIIEAACQMLGMQSDREDWNTPNYVEALRRQFHHY